MWLIFVQISLCPAWGGEGREGEGYATPNVESWICQWLLLVVVVVAVIELLLMLFSLILLLLNVSVGVCSSDANV